MSLYSLRPFEPWHYVMLAETIEAARGRMLDGDKARMARSFDTEGLARSGFCDNALIVTAGVFTPWTGYGITWALVVPNAQRHARFIHTVVKQGLSEFIFRLKLRRLEANVDESQAQAIKWVEKLGFEEESTMPKFGPQGQTFRKFVILL